MTREDAVRAAQAIDKIYLKPRSNLIRRDDYGTSRPHLRWMVQEMTKGMSEDKTMRWLGYIQGVLVSLYHIPLADMKAMNRAHPTD